MDFWRQRQARFLPKKTHTEPSKTTENEQSIFLPYKSQTGFVCMNFSLSTTASRYLKQQFPDPRITYHGRFFVSTHRTSELYDFKKLGLNLKLLIIFGYRNIENKCGMAFQQRIWAVSFSVYQNFTKHVLLKYFKTFEIIDPYHLSLI